ncbi:MAG: ABC transporter permease [Pseudomonadota bacterium]
MTPERPTPRWHLAPPRLSLRWLPVWQRNLLVWRKLLIPAILGNILEPLLYLLALGYGLGMFVGQIEGVDYITFLASGFICASAMNAATFEGLYSVYTRMSVQKTWDGMLAAPLSVDDVLLGELIWVGTKSLISGAAIMVVALGLGAVKISGALPALLMIFVVGLCFGAMALIATSFARSYDFFMYYFTLLITPMFLFTGVFFPIDQLPAAVAWIAQLLPLTHGVEIVRPLLMGAPVQDFFYHFSIILLYTLCSFYLSLVLFRLRMAK